MLIQLTGLVRDSLWHVYPSDNAIFGNPYYKSPIYNDNTTYVIELLADHVPLSFIKSIDHITYQSPFLYLIRRFTDYTYEINAIVYFARNLIRCGHSGFVSSHMHERWLKYPKIFKIVAKIGDGNILENIWYSDRFTKQDRIYALKHLQLTWITEYCKYYSILTIILKDPEYREIFMNRFKSYNTKKMRELTAYRSELSYTHKSMMRHIISSLRYGVLQDKRFTIELIEGWITTDLIPEYIDALLQITDHAFH